MTVVCWLALSGIGLANEEINGLLLDQTRTLLGHEFARQFAAKWVEPRSALSYNIVIREIPDPRWGSLLRVEVNGVEVDRRTLRPRAGGAEEAASESARKVRWYLGYVLKTNGDQGSADLQSNGY